MGRFSPSCSRFCSITFSGACPPSIADTGSPGMSLSTAKIMVRRMKTMGMVMSVRAMMYLNRFFMVLACLPQAPA